MPPPVGHLLFAATQAPKSSRQERDLHAQDSLASFTQRDRLKGFLRQFEHTVGVNGFFVRLAVSAPTSGRFLGWLNAAESIERFECGGKTLSLRPDASGTVAAEERLRRFFLEWDRGTMRGSQMREKFHYYAAYFASRRTTSDVGIAVLIVTKSPHRENAIWNDLEKAFHEVNGEPNRCFTSVDTLIDGPGPLARIWRSFGSAGRFSWLEPRVPGVLDPSAEGSTTRRSGL